LQRLPDARPMCLERRPLRTRIVPISLREM